MKALLLTLCLLAGSVSAATPDEGSWDLEAGTGFVAEVLTGYDGVTVIGVPRVSLVFQRWLAPRARIGLFGAIGTRHSDPEGRGRAMPPHIELGVAATHVFDTMLLHSRFGLTVGPYYYVDDGTCCGVWPGHDAGGSFAFEVGPAFRLGNGMNIEMLGRVVPWAGELPALGVVVSATYRLSW